MGDFSLQGHMTPIQYAQRMSNANGIEKPNDLGEDIELGDIEIEDVAPKKERVPFLTKRGKIVVALLIVGGALYYIWKRSQSKKSNVESPEVNQQEAQKSEITAETSSQTVQNSSQEDGTVDTDLV